MNPRTAEILRIGHDVSAKSQEQRCRDLWAAVMAQAVEDALYDNPNPSDPIRRYDHNDQDRVTGMLCKVNATNWLLYGGEAFNQCCERAGLEPAAVRDAARRMLLNGRQV